MLLPSTLALALLGAAASGAQPVAASPVDDPRRRATRAPTPRGASTRRRPEGTWPSSSAPTSTRCPARTASRSENRGRYTMAVTNEALAFLEHYPERKDELVRRLREGRITLSPFLNNTLWGWQSEEAFLRSLYPARRLERAWGVPIDVAHHTELPSLPWGAASLLAGAGVRWLAIPFLDYDTQWAGLDVPPLFVLEGPDGGRVRVVLDAWASRRHNYVQGRALLEDPKRIEAEWLPRFEALGAAYPFRDVLALGTHGDLGPQSAGEVERFTAAIRDWNAQPAPAARLVNATLAGFCRSIDAAEASRALPVLRGDLGHSWEAWPVSLAALATAARQAEREMLAAEALAVLAGGDALAAATREPRERAEWSWAMLGDHAWNGTDDANRRENASLRRRWADELVEAARDLAGRAWEAAGFEDRSDAVTVYNPTGVPRQDVVRFAVPPGRPKREVRDADGRVLPSQHVVEDDQLVVYFVPPRLEAFSVATLGLAAGGPPPPTPLTATGTSLDGPYYRLTVDPRTGGLASLVHKPTGRETRRGRTAHARPDRLLRRPGSRRSRGSRAVSRRSARCSPASTSPTGPAPRRRTSSSRSTRTWIGWTSTTTCASRRSPSRSGSSTSSPSSPPARPCASTRPGRSSGPRPSPDGDLVPGGNTRRFAIQGFVDASGPGGGTTVVTRDAFLLRNDLEPLSFEALGNDQNFKEVTKDQGGATDFRFRYAIRAHAGDYDGAHAFAWSRSVAMPVEALRGRIRRPPAAAPAVDPARAIVLALKPPDDPSARGLVLRLRETAGRSGPLTIATGRARRAVRLDLLEREGARAVDRGRDAAARSPGPRLRRRAPGVTSPPPSHPDATGGRHDLLLPPPRPDRRPARPRRDRGRERRRREGKGRGRHAEAGLRGHALRGPQLALDRSLPGRPRHGRGRRARPAARLLHRRDRRRRVEDDERRHRVGAGHRRPGEDGLGRRDRGGAVRPERPLRRHGRELHPRQRLPRRRRLPLDGRGQDLDARGPARHAADRPHPRPPAGPRPRVRGRPRPHLGAERRARRLPLAGRREDLVEGALRGRQDGRRRSRDGPGQPARPLRRRSGRRSGRRGAWRAAAPAARSTRRPTAATRGRSSTARACRRARGAGSA